MGKLRDKLTGKRKSKSRPTLNFWPLIATAFLLPLYGYYTSIQKGGWLDSSFSILKETATLLLLTQYIFGNYQATSDAKRPVGERNVRRAVHAANVAGTVYVGLGLVWGSLLLFWTERHEREHVFDLMNNRLYLAGLMGVTFVGLLLSLKPGAGEVGFLKSAVRRPWVLFFPGMGAAGVSEKGMRSVEATPVQS